MTERIQIRRLRKADSDLAKTQITFSKHVIDYKHKYMFRTPKRYQAKPLSKEPDLVKLAEKSE